MAADQSDHAQWFLLQTKSKQELRAAENLDRQGVVSFCPMVLVEKITRGQRVQSLEVLFPRYLFVRLEDSSISATSVRSTRGVSHFVTSAGTPIAVHKGLVEQLRERVEQNADVVVSSMPKVGEKLQIVDGPFRGLNAVFCQTDGNSRAMVLITMLNQQVKATMSLSNLSPL
ncbi:MAG: transcription/translation regulatory transformer protein RfaH [Porticoccaceae bacterium]|nr:transcription/translation regulatory transformer protein RfaH [Porticoccaceae bacterium]